MSIPKTMRAVKNTAMGEAKIVDDEPVPEVRDGYILVKVSHVAVNPTDWKHIDYLASPGATVGCDFSGTVVAIGKNPAKPWSVGDRVAGLVHGNKKGSTSSGSFAEYCLMRSHQGLKIPSNISDAQAATLGVGVATIGLGLYQMLNIPLPDQRGKTRAPGSILIYGGSTATGLLAIQFAALSGLRVLTTCSPHSFDKVKSLGAAEAWDYHDAAACGPAIRKATDDGLLLAFDTIAEGDSTRICMDALTSQRGRAGYVATLNYEKTRDDDDVWQSWLYAYTSFGEEFEDLGMQWEPKPDDVSYVGRFWLLVEQLLAHDKVKFFVLPREGGLSEQGVMAGMDEMRQGKVSGGKLVYKIA